MIYLFAFILVFHFSGSDKEQTQEGDNQVRLGRVLSLLQDLSSFVTRSCEVVKNVVQQLAALYSKYEKVYLYIYVILISVFTTVKCYPL